MVLAAQGTCRGSNRELAMYIGSHSSVESNEVVW